MSFENFQLTPLLIQELYNNYLIDLDNEQIKQDSLKTAAPGFLGKNARNILILVSDPGNPYLSDESLSFLLGILNACKLSVQDIALVNLYSMDDPDYASLVGQFQAEKVIAFGVSPASIGMPVHFPDYQLQSIGNKVYLMAPALEKLAVHQEEKRQLWNSLRKMFSL